jgi:hypothetical protein
MSNEHTPSAGEQVVIQVQGHLDARWSAWLDGLSVTTDADGCTTLRGTVVDQAALFGLLQRLRDTGLPLLSVRTGPSDDA